MSDKRIVDNPPGSADWVRKQFQGPASADTGPQGEDPKGLSSSGGAVGEAETPKPPHTCPDRDVVEALKYAIGFIETLPEDCMGMNADVIDFQTGEQGQPYPIRDEWLHNARAALSALPPQDERGRIVDAIYRERDYPGAYNGDQRLALTAIARLIERGEHLTDQAPPRQGWMPIETAPRNGEWSLLWNDDAMFTGYWIAGGWNFVEPVEQRLPPHLRQPTHWMPLPAPPRQDGSDA